MNKHCQKHVIQDYWKEEGQSIQANIRRKKVVGEK